MKNKRKLIVLSGIPGTGKSVLRSKLEKTIPNVFVYSTDDIVSQWAVERNSTYSQIWAESIQEATQLAENLFTEALKQGKNIIIDRTNLSPKARRKYLARLSPKDWTFNCVQILKPETESEMNALKSRLTKRSESEGKVITDELLQDFLKQFVEVTDEEPFNDFMLLNMYGSIINKDDRKFKHFRKY